MERHDNHAPAPDRMSGAEIRELTEGKRDFEKLYGSVFTEAERASYHSLLARCVRSGCEAHDSHGLCKALMTMRTARLFADAIDPDHNILCAIALYPLLRDGATDILSLRREWGEDVASLIVGIDSVKKFSTKNSNIDADNFRGLLVSLADDIRVIIIMIVNHLVLMRSINRHPDEEWVRNVAFEANYLYAQLAHRLGLYKIKGELEDLSLKYTDREIYTSIARKLNETKASRDAYIKDFIDPVKRKLTEAGLKFEIKGRTKSIYSIWGKMKKQKVDIQGIYDLFAIRVIIDTPREREKADCWLAYSILADMYTANPARMKDWISIPKSNGYESLHATVMGPGSKWVEVQFRTRRMDLVAEKGLAAHWRYKGGHSDSTDQWMNNIRDILESAEGGPMQLMRGMKLDGSGKEVFAFTPKGDLFRLAPGATVLDFAFQIHSNVGAHCTGAVVNGRHRKINHRISSGDTVEILTSSTQSPKADWLNMVVTTKARNKIRQSLNEERMHKAELGRELLERRFRNRKIEAEEAVVMRLIKKLGYKHSTDFFADVADSRVDPSRFIATYLSATEPETQTVRQSAGEFQLHEEQTDRGGDNVFFIGGKTINGLSYRFARCCQPVQGDPVFGFISTDGTLKIHKCGCPNAQNIRRRYPYRIVNVEWNVAADAPSLPADIRVVGNDDLGILSSITSIITKEPEVALRNISVDTHDGLFSSQITVAVTGSSRLSALMRKLRTVKGVKDVARL